MPSVLESQNQSPLDALIQSPLDAFSSGARGDLYVSYRNFMVGGGVLTTVGYKEIYGGAATAVNYTPAAGHILYGDAYCHGNAVCWLVWDLDATDLGHVPAWHVWRIKRSTDYGLNWNTVHTWNLTDDSSGNRQWFARGDDGAIYCYVVGNTTHWQELYKSTDDGVNWSLVYNFYSGLGSDVTQTELRCLVTWQSGQFILIGGKHFSGGLVRPVIFISTDSGTTFTKHVLPDPGGNYECANVWRTTNGNMYAQIYIASNHSHIIESADGGTTWNLIYDCVDDYSFFSSLWGNATFGNYIYSGERWLLATDDSYGTLPIIAAPDAWVTLGEGHFGGNGVVITQFWGYTSFTRDNGISKRNTFFMNPNAGCRADMW
jgi:hypothetical protein